MITHKTNKTKLCKQSNAKTSHSSSNTSVKPNNVVRDKEKLSPWAEDYLDLSTWRIRPVTESFIEKLANDLILWADNEKNVRQIRLNQFIRTTKIPSITFYRWTHKYPNLKSAHDYAMAAIADKRESGAAIREYSDSVLRMMPLYDKEWERVEQWKASLKEQAQAERDIVINLPNITNYETNKDQD